jgi:RIO kinase 2
VGKESDIFVVAAPTGEQLVLKLHRLGRISFRTVKANRDYLRNRQNGSWMYMSRLAAIKEYAFMSALHTNNFPVPTPIAQSRHTLVMSLIDAFPMRTVASVPDPASLYADLIALLLRLAQHGLIHGDFNEFNILLIEKPDPAAKGGLQITPILIDFPQMVSMDHANAEFYFDRDVACIKRFFLRRFHFTPTEPGPFFEDARKVLGRDGVPRLDVQVEASGFSRQMAKELEKYMKEVGVETDAENDGKVPEDGEEEEEEFEEEGEDEEEEEENGEAAEASAEDESKGKEPELPEDAYEYTTDKLGNTIRVLKDLKINDTT